MQNSLKIAALI